MAKKVAIKPADLNIAVIGAGSWGTAIATLLAEKGFEVVLWARDAVLVEDMKRLKRNPRYLTDLDLPETLSFSSDLKEALPGAGLVVMAVPSHGMRKAARSAREHLTGKTIVSLAKGIEAETYLRMSEVIASELGPGSEKDIAVISGPNHAEEVSRRVPSATVAAANDKEVAKRVQEIFMTPYFRVYTNPDIIGVEMAAASKNVIALATGMSDGLGYGDNTRAALMTRGLAEMTRLGIIKGAEASTFSGLAGLGDLIATCTSLHSRNRATGEKIAKGMTLSEIAKETSMVAEGVTAAKNLHDLAVKAGLDMPITEAVFRVLYQGKKPKDCVGDLMARGAKDEAAALGQRIKPC
ncbi:MAG: NAD(P)H-dependent glycerol-3-phosphate dehydrogenase [Actinomycetota bacterium]|nr:NAD(P)H-dependent glycerol-3-phosphate dehydrogenase [Actinomycetota bacterium]